MTEGDPLKPLIHQAGRLLARRAHSRADLRDRLLRMAGETLVDQAIARLEELQLLNDFEYAHTFASRRIKNESWGPARVRHALLRHRVAPGIADAAVAKACGEIGEAQVLDTFLDRECRIAGMPRDRRGIARLVQRLRRRGFSDDTIFSALRGRIPAGAWKQFDSES